MREKKYNGKTSPIEIGDDGGCFANTASSLPTSFPCYCPCLNGCAPLWYHNVWQEPHVELGAGCSRLTSYDAITITRQGGSRLHEIDTAVY